MKHWMFSAAVACALVIMAPWAAPVAAKETLPGPRIATVLRVIDGDSMWVETRLWLNQRMTINVRLAGIDTPELRSECETKQEKAHEKALAQQAKDALAALLANGEVQLFDIQHDKYAERVVAKVLLFDGTDVAQHMLNTGHARRYHGGKRGTWCE